VAAGNVQGSSYIVVNLDQSIPPVIDWSSSATSSGAMPNDLWNGMIGSPMILVDLLSAQTGLVVRRD
jgi:hypothetical protein